MGITAAVGLLALLGIPAIILLYMLKPKHHNKVISSTFLWRQVFDEIESASRIHRLRQSLLMFLEILAVVLFAMILAGIYMNRTGISNHVVLILDGSVSMQAQDMSPSRFEKAKEAAEDYILGLKEGTGVTLVFLGSVPEVVLRDETNSAIIRAAIEQRQVTNGKWDMSLLTATLEGLDHDGATERVYFGDRSVGGAVNYNFTANAKNYGLFGIAYKAYASSESLALMTEVVNSSDIGDEVMVSLYVDGYYLTSKKVYVAGNDSSQVFFDGIGVEGSEITVEIDNEDALALDNTVTTYIRDTPVIKVAYVSDGNVFLEKILRAQSQMDVYVIRPDSIAEINGYDLYIFDGTMPAVRPNDGNSLYIHPPENSGFDILGYLEYPAVSIGNSNIMSVVDQADFNLMGTQVYKPSDDYETIYETEHGPIAYLWREGMVRCGVIGFDIRYSDLPLDVAFPIVMTGIFEALTEASMTEHGSVYVNDTLSIQIFPGTEEAWITDPQGRAIALDTSSAETDFRNTEAIGSYEISQRQGEEVLTEKFFVNVPPDSSEEGQISDDSETTVRNYDTQETLRSWIGMALFALLLINWFIYSHRRKRYAFKH